MPGSLRSLRGLPAAPAGPGREQRAAGLWGRHHPRLTRAAALGGQKPMSWVGAEPSSKQQSKQPRDARGKITVAQKGPLVPELLSTWPWGRVAGPGSLWSCLHLGDHLSPCLHTHHSSCPHPRLCPRSLCLDFGDTPVPPRAPQARPWCLAPEGWYEQTRVLSQESDGPRSSRGLIPEQLCPRRQRRSLWKLGEPGQSPPLSLTEQPRALHQHQAHTALACFFFYKMYL